MELGAQIRAYRISMGLTQDELAKKVYVARQTVCNWEQGKTLPDVESLRRMARLFGITIDELLDPGRAELVARAVQDRHEFIWLLITVIAADLCWFVLMLSEPHVIHAFAPNPAVADTLSWVFLAFKVACCVCMYVFGRRMNRFKREHDLLHALDIAMYIEGREFGSSLPDDFFYRVLIPHWGSFQIFISFAVVVLVFITHPWS